MRWMLFVSAHGNRHMSKVKSWTGESGQELAQEGATYDFITFAVSSCNNNKVVSVPTQAQLSSCPPAMLSGR